MKGRYLNILFILCTLSILSGCAAALEGIAARTVAGEALAAEGAALTLTRAGLTRAASVRVLAGVEAVSLRSVARSLSAEGISVESFGFSRVRVHPTHTPQLYYYEANGVRKYIADIISENTLRWNATGETTIFKDAVFKISNRTVNVRTYAGTSYSILHTLAPAEPVLVLREMGAWSQVLYNKGEIGWIKSSLLVAVLASNVSQSTTDGIDIQAVNSPSQVTTCYSCWGSGDVSYSLRCGNCNASGYLRCGNCNASGYLRCGNCNAGGYLRCSSCNGGGYLRCSNCSGGGYLRCAYCKGSGYWRDRKGNLYQCSSCNGQGQFACSICRGQGQLVCNHCSGQGQFVCAHCMGQGQFVCSICNGQGLLVCNQCSGQGQQRTKVKCSKCNGTGHL